MQSNDIIDEFYFDRELSICDAYGPSIIFCNLFTCQKLLKNIGCENSFTYKGHKIYIDNHMNDFVYRIFPIIKIEKLLQVYKNIYEYNEENKEYE